MSSNLALRVRLYPTPEQEVAFAKISGCCRLVYNLALEQRSDFWRQYRRSTGSSLSWIAQKRELPSLKEALPFLKEVPAHCLQAAMQDLDQAYTNFFERRAGYPRRKRKYAHDSFRFPDPAQIKIVRSKGMLILPKFGKTAKDAGPIKARFHRGIRGEVRSVTITRDGNHWYASILYRLKKRKVSEDVADLVESDILGIDRGVIVPMMTSNGQVLRQAIAPSPKSGRARRGLRLQQQLARQKKGSNRRAKTKLRLAAFKAREKRQRKDMIEKASTEVARSCRVAVMENLSVQAMTASASGTVEEPGRNVAAKAGLNRAILDKGWGMFLLRTEQKLAAKGGFVLRVPAAYTSQRCSCCGEVSDKSRVTQARFACVNCGHVMNADHNAARNIRRLGIERLGLAVPDSLAAGTAVTARGASGDDQAKKREQTTELDPVL